MSCRSALAFCFLLCTSILAHADHLRYRDERGITWQRQILSEPQRDSRRLLLVVDIPDDPRVLQQTVYKQSFAANESAEMAAQKSRWSAADSLRIGRSIQNVSARALWPVTQSWNPQFEAAFGQWVHDNAAMDMLKDGGVDVDCADFAITLRWIFAHDHGLPAANSLAGSGRLFGSWQSSSSWDKLPTNANWKKDERFKAALRYLLENSYTHSLLGDLYPISVTPQFVSPGAIYLTLFMDSGHTRTIFDIGPSKNCTGLLDRCISIIWGNEPASEEGFITDMVPYMVKKGEGGFLRHRWPEQSGGTWKLRAPEQMPGYSLEQFGWTEDDYLAHFSAQMDLWTSTNDQYVLVGQGVMSALESRVFTTIGGYFMCSLTPCNPGEALYDAYSTPQRDQQLLKSMQSFEIAAAKADPNADQVQKFNEAMEQSPLSESFPTYRELASVDAVKRFASDPRADFFARWGMPTPPAKNALEILTTIVYFQWIMRAQMVMIAQAKCFPNGGTQPVCSAQDPAVKRLATDRLDQSLRKFQKDFAQKFASLSVVDRSGIELRLRTLPGVAPYCSGPDNMCMLYDFFIDQDGRHVQTMSSDPRAPIARRYGF